MNDTFSTFETDLSRLTPTAPDASLLLDVAYEAGRRDGATQRPRHSLRMAASVFLALGLAGAGGFWAGQGRETVRIVEITPPPRSKAEMTQQPVNSDVAVALRPIPNVTENPGPATPSWLASLLGYPTSETWMPSRSTQPPTVLALQRAAASPEGLDLSRFRTERRIQTNTPERNTSPAPEADEVLRAFDRPTF